MTTEQTKKVRVAVIGLGAMAHKIHLPILKTLASQGRIELSVACDLRADAVDRAVSGFGFSEGSTNPQQVVSRTDIDAVYLFGPAQMHFQFGRLAIESGKHIFVEKPIAPSYADAKVLADLAAQYRVIAVAGYNRRFYKSFAEINRSAGATKWQLIEATFHQPFFETPPTFGVRTWLTANGIHAIDAMCFLAGGMPSHIASSALQTGASNVASNFAALLTWDNGTHATFAAYHSAAAKEEQYVLYGIERTYAASDSALSIVTRGGEEERMVFTNEDAPVIRGFVPEHVAFVDAINGTYPNPPHLLGNCIHSLYVAERIEEGYSGILTLPESSPVLAVDSGAPKAAPAYLGSPSVLVCDPQALGTMLPRIAERATIVRPDEIATLSTAERESIVYAVTGRAGGAIPETLLEMLPNLKAVGIVGLSLRKFEPERLIERGITIFNASESYARAVAEYIVMAALIGRRMAVYSHEYMRKGGWGISPVKKSFSTHMRDRLRRLRPLVARTPLLPFAQMLWNQVKPATSAGGVRGKEKGPNNLSGATIGLIGWSANAKALVRYLTPFGARILVYSANATPADIVAEGAKPASLAEVLAADVVSLHRGLNAQTRKSIGQSEIAQLKPGAVFINAARAELVDNVALEVRLKKGDIYACLDVFEPEPLVATSPLRKLPNVFLTSHIAGATRQMYSEASEEVAEKLVALLEGRELTDSIRSLSRLETMT